MGDPKYPLDLFQRVITVSLETMKIVSASPSWSFHEKWCGAGALTTASSVTRRL